MTVAEDLTHDAYLGGRLAAVQPRRGFRSGIDAVLLASAVPARPGQAVLDLGCGAGVAGLCLAARVDGVKVVGVELQPRYADLARRNARENDLPLDVVTADLGELPESLRARSFDHVMTNPPYFVATGGTPAAEPGRGAALVETTPRYYWLDVAIRRLRPNGVLTLIQRVARLPDILTALGDGRMGAIEVRPLASRAGRSARLVVLRARKGRRTPLELLSPLILHEGAQHRVDADSYTPTLSAILRDGAPMPGFHP